MTQSQLADEMGKSRHWVGQLERGHWYGKDTFTVGADTALRLAMALNLPPAEVLRAGGVPEDNWPDLSQFRSVDVYTKHVDITPLTQHQQNIIESLVDEFKHLNRTASE